MSGGKWKGMMSSKHVDFVNWNDEGSKYPEPVYLDYAKCSDQLVSVNMNEPVILGKDAGELVFSSGDLNIYKVTPHTVSAAASAVT